jgi:hypothetical protein
MRLPYSRSESSGVTTQKPVWRGIKRLILESEFARTLHVLRRTGNTLSTIVRQAWDIGIDDSMSVMTKTPTTVVGPHIGIIGHCTQQELFKTLSETELSNGFANRFLWVATTRARVLPFAQLVQPEVVLELATRLKSILLWAKNGVILDWHVDSHSAWRQIYPVLSSEQPTFGGAIKSRAEVQVLRLAGIYAVMDKSEFVEPEHLIAGVAAWEYCAESVDYVFGKNTGNAIADKILAALEHRQCLSKTDVMKLLNNNARIADVDYAIRYLLDMGLIHENVQPTTGRSRTVYQMGGV